MRAPWLIALTQTLKCFLKPHLQRCLRFKLNFIYSTHYSDFRHSWALQSVTACFRLFDIVRAQSCPFHATSTGSRLAIASRLNTIEPIRFVAPKLVVMWSSWCFLQHHLMLWLNLVESWGYSASCPSCLLLFTAFTLNAFAIEMNSSMRCSACCSQIVSNYEIICLNIQILNHSIGSAGFENSVGSSANVIVVIAGFEARHIWCFDW